MCADDSRRPEGSPYDDFCAATTVTFTCAVTSRWILTGTDVSPSGGADGASPTVAASPLEAPPSDAAPSEPVPSG